MKALKQPAAKKHQGLHGSEMKTEVPDSQDRR